MAEYFQFKGTFITTTGVTDIYDPTTGQDGALTNASGTSVILSALASNTSTGNVSVNLYTTLTGSTSTDSGTVDTESGSFLMGKAIVVPANSSLEFIVNKANVKYGSKLRALSSVASGIVFTVSAVDIQP
jgi:hypothetical protein